MRQANHFLISFFFAILPIGTVPLKAATTGVTQAYVLFDTNTADHGASDALRSRSLTNCKQLLVGQILKEVIFHLQCQESDEGNQTKFLSQAVTELAGVDGVDSAMILVVRRD